MKKGKVASEKYNELTLQKRELTPSSHQKKKNCYYKRGTSGNM
jgi:hypothetical protein